jgi:hypothetical protein
MLNSLYGKCMAKVPHADTYNRVKSQLGEQRLQELRRGLDDVVDRMSPNKSGLRSFNSSHLGSKLSPWRPPIRHLYDVARELAGQSADEEDVQDEAAKYFGQLIWECLMNRREKWVFWDPK